MRFPFAVILAATTLLGAACGSAGRDGSAEADPAVGPVATSVTLPRVEVVDVTADRPVELSSLLPADRPLLLWFWAPH